MTLTKAEEQLMTYLWNLGKGYFKDIKELYPDPKPATTTINTLLKRMIDKGFVAYVLHGNSREYYPLVKRNDYLSKQVKGLIKSFFNNSTEQFASFFAHETDMSEEDLKRLREIVDDKINLK
jgi:predicted transcriptional regulator